jgi:hypothetical protein
VSYSFGFLCENGELAGRFGLRFGSVPAVVVNGWVRSPYFVYVGVCKGESGERGDEKGAHCEKHCKCSRRRPGILELFARADTMRI